MAKKVTQGERSVFDVDLGILDVASVSPIVRPFDLTAIVLADSKICWRTDLRQLLGLYYQISHYHQYNCL